jgi:hypothetical protein
MFVAAVADARPASDRPVRHFKHSSCSYDTYRRADDSFDYVHVGWPALLKHRRTFAACDDGGLAEGYSDAIVRLLAHRWDQFGTFVAISKRHPEFQRWAIQHIDATTSDDDLKKVELNAGSCINNRKTRVLCKAIQEAAESARAELSQTLETSR